MRGGVKLFNNSNILNSFIYKIKTSLMSVLYVFAKRLNLLRISNKIKLFYKKKLFK